MFDSTVKIIIVCTDMLLVFPGFSFSFCVSLKFRYIFVL